MHALLELTQPSESGVDMHMALGKLPSGTVYNVILKEASPTRGGPISTCGSCPSRPIARIHTRGKEMCAEAARCLNELLASFMCKGSLRLDFSFRAPLQNLKHLDPYSYPHPLLVESSPLEPSLPREQLPSPQLSVSKVAKKILV